MSFSGQLKKYEYTVLANLTTEMQEVKIIMRRVVQLIHETVMMLNWVME